MIYTRIELCKKLSTILTDHQRIVVGRVHSDALQAIVTILHELGNGFTLGRATLFVLFNEVTINVDG